ncbi:MAG: FHA domain-containing protein [Candidatus Adiutrix sp.]|jgi:hypothetical protein|nr:FHA domain-containing protein [Candidatus Adiutrix sp.]
MPKFFLTALPLTGAWLLWSGLTGSAAAQFSLSDLQAVTEGRPVLLLLAAFVLLTAGVYFWWQSRLEEEYADDDPAPRAQEKAVEPRPSRVAPELIAYLTRERDREPAVDIDNAFITPEGPRAVIAPVHLTPDALEEARPYPIGASWRRQGDDRSARLASPSAGALRSAKPLGGTSLAKSRPGETGGRLGRGEVRARTASAASGGRSLAPSTSSPFSLEFPETNRKVQLRRGVMSIGSAPDNHIVLDELEVAPKHIEIYVLGGECAMKLRDADGAVKLNGRSVFAAHTPLKPGDELRIGRTRARLNKSEALVRKPREYQRPLQEA